MEGTGKHPQVVSVFKLLSNYGALDGNDSIPKVHLKMFRFFSSNFFFQLMTT